jgi:nucleoside-diphosphate-sugar epimerase
VPFVSLRPGAFVDQFGMWGGDGFAAGRVAWTGDSTVPLTFVYTPDLADNLAAAVDADVSPGERIDIGWDRPLSARELADLAGRILGSDLELMEIDPAQIRRPGMSDEARNDLLAMFEYFRSGRYVANTQRQAEVFGSLPTAEDAMRRRLAALGHVS